MFEFDILVGDKRYKSKSDVILAIYEAAGGTVTLNPDGTKGVSTGELSVEKMISLVRTGGISPALYLWTKQNSKSFFSTLDLPDLDIAQSDNYNDDGTLRKIQWKAFKKEPNKVDPEVKDPDPVAPTPTVELPETANINRDDWISDPIGWTTSNRRTVSKVRTAEEKLRLRKLYRSYDDKKNEKERQRRLALTDDPKIKAAAESKIEKLDSEIQSIKNELDNEFNKHPHYTDGKERLWTHPGYEEYRYYEPGEDAKIASTDPRTKLKKAISVFNDLGTGLAAVSPMKYVAVEVTGGGYEV